MNQDSRYPSGFPVEKFLNLRLGKRHLQMLHGSRTKVGPVPVSRVSASFVMAHGFSSLNTTKRHSRSIATVGHGSYHQILFGDCSLTTRIDF